ncbi:MAG: TIGR01777 family protein [Gammaproteobacteria bacterium]|nr:TIGR01777 family protein [Gammaproteobacteria bacterium]HBW82670.1 TIGR01777 family protein [Gammaproteobacteria bacterium]
MNIMITGSNGMIGSALSKRLALSGHKIFRLNRFDRSAPFYYDMRAGRMHFSPDITLDAVINLAGANISEKRWNPKRKEEILESRRMLTHALCKTLSESQAPPQTLLSASAIGYYGNQLNQPVDEQSPPGDDFLAKVSVLWEEATEAATTAGIRTVLLRFGLVLDATGGVLKNLVMPGGLAVVGRLGQGEHKMSWISLTDAIEVMLACLQNTSFSGPLNVVAPEVVSNKEFAQALIKAKGRPALPPIPAAIVKLMFGEMADAALLASSNVRSTRLVETGVKLSCKNLDSALSNCFASSTQ